MFAVRPAELLALPELKEMAKEFARPDGIEADFGVVPNQLEQLTIASVGNNPCRFLVLLYFKPASVPQKTIDRLFADSETVEVAGQEFRRRRDGRVGCVLQANPRYVVIAENDATLQQVIAAGNEGATRAEWARSWLASGKCHAQIYLETAVLREKIAASPWFFPPQEAAAIATVAPLWQSVKSIDLSMTVADEVRLSMTAEGESPEKASRFFNTFAAVTTFSRNYLDFVRETFGRISDGILPEMTKPFEAADALLASMRYEITGTKVLVTMRGETRLTSRLLAGLLPAATRLRATIRQSISKNNLKQIITALHIHHDVFNELPAALRYGLPGKPKSEHPHSWRVALLPWLEQTQLYNQYKLDEPWDSPANLKILEKIPDVYRDPYETVPSTNTPYVALIGQGLAFAGRQAVRIRDFSDGLEQTIMVVESDRKVPWTKPEDIPYEADKPFPFVGNRHVGRFLAAFGDGKILAVAPALDDKILRSLFTISGGEKVSLDELKVAVD